MEPVRRGGRWLGTLLACASCTGGQTGESPRPSEPLALYTGGDGRCEARACTRGKPSTDELNQFGEHLGPTGNYVPLHTIDEALAGRTFIATGWLVGVEDGRRSYHGDSCVRHRREEDGSRGACVAWEPAYSSYVNLVIETESVLRGEVPVPAEYLRVEFHWPNNRPIGDLVASLPHGARVLVLSEWVENARQQAAPLEEAGVDPGYIAGNLLAPLSYGMALEDAEGFAARQPFYGGDLSQLIDPDGGAVRFDDLLSTVEAALE